MFNFTGTSKKRVVNLGDKRSNKGKNFLEQARIDRIQREETRQREKCILIIQRYLRRRLELLCWANEFLKEWMTLSNPDWLIWAAQFAFISKYGRRQDLIQLLPILKTGIATLAGALNERSVAVLIGGLNRKLSLKAESAETGAVLECIIDLIKMYGIPHHFQTKWSGIIENLLAIAEEEKSAVDIIFAFAKHDSLEAFVRFIASAPPDMFRLSESRAHVLDSTLSTPECIDIVANLSDLQKTQLLVNVLVIQAPQYNPEDYVIHANILSVMNFSVKVQSDDDNDQLVQESRIESSALVTISQDVAEVLLVLYSSSYVTHAFSQLQHFGSGSKMAVQFISLLMYLFPEARTKLCMMMTIMPGLDHWMFAQLSSHPAYIEFKNQEKTTDALSAESLTKIMQLDDTTLFLNLLHTYEQLLSYWLIVANDHEMSLAERFKREDMVDFTMFLKIFCLTLIFRTNDVLKVSREMDLERLTDISISLLNQLYIKNLRQKFLPNGFWTLRSIKFEIDNMIQIVLDDEERMKESANASSDEETTGPSVPKRHRTSDMESKLQVLNKVPFFVNFTDRVKVFQSLIDADQEALESREPWQFFGGDNGSKLTADIYRDAVLDGAFERFHKVGSQFKNKLQVTFYNEHGVEAGIDGGGLTKEFLTSVVEESFNPKAKLHLFRETAEHALYPNEDIFLKILKRIDLSEQHLRLQYMRFVGMIVGKCLYESVLIDVAFAPFFLSKWRVAQTSMKNSVNDLKYLDRDLYNNLNKLFDMSDDQIAQLDLDFTINEQVGSQTLQYDLQSPNGDSIKVTAANRLNYIHQIANFKLNQSLHIQTKYFLEGLFELINPTWLNMFDPFELQMLISGGNDVNIDDWKANVLYGGYFDDDVTVVLFWQVVEEMTPRERCDLIKFVTSVSRAPLLGFGALSPKFGIHNSGPSNRLPTASTCVNLLKLPDYKDKAIIREKLLYSISANSGFDLS